MVCKKCSTCGEVKEVERFYKNRSKKDGYAHQCKECDSVYRAKYLKENPGKYLALLAQQSKYQKKNSVTIKQRKSQYYKKNKQKISDILAKNYKKNRDKRRRYHAKRHKQIIKKLPAYYLIPLIKKQFPLIVNVKITPEMIELKRQQILLNREIKAAKKELKDGANRV